MEVDEPETTDDLWGELRAVGDACLTDNEHGLLFGTADTIPPQPQDPASPRAVVSRIECEQRVKPLGTPFETWPHRWLRLRSRWGYSVVERAV